MKKNPTIALIVAAGSSSRYWDDVPKPYINLHDRPVLAHSLATFTKHPGIDGVRVVISRAHHPLYKKAAKDFQLFTPVIGGERRQDSVRIGLEAVARVNPGKVLIHDAARPLVDAELIDRVLKGLDEAPAVLPCMPVVDTIRQTGKSLELLDRDKLIAAQTPQGFDFDKILAAHRQFINEDVTDDIALAELAGLGVKLVEGSEKNIKLTTQNQHVILESMMNQAQATTTPAQRETRIGQGFDVHAFEESAGELSLCGVRIAHTKTLKGHSDADVGLHALVDALLGAMAEGDIGQHFPPSDDKWKGADSKIFVQHAVELLKQKGGEINHMDLTIIGEEPKISPHREVMRQQVSGLLSVDVRRVSIKATTTEKLGFLGRGEGLAAQAVATITLPG